MKNLIKVTAVAFLCGSLFTLKAQVHHSEGIYRIPYADGTSVKVTRNHQTHFIDDANTILECRIDMKDMSGSDSIVAAADGWIRAIVDNFTLQLDCDTTPNNNNYVWIEHPNGEWTKYTHMLTQSTSVTAGLNVDDYVCAGTFLGYEDDIGCASGDHLHFEVARPTDGTNVLQYSFTGGYIDQDVAENIIPVICDISGGVFEDDAFYTAGPCDYNGCSNNGVYATQQVNDDVWFVDIVDDFISAGDGVDFYSGSNGVYQAGDYISLLEGFTAHQGSSFSARIRSCNNPGWDVSGCDNNRSANESVVVAEESISIQPNPARDITQVLVNLSEFPVNASLQIYNMLGIPVFNEKITNQESVIAVSLHDLPASTYQVVCFNNNVIVNTTLLVVIK
jgi:hypothetical protein